MPYKKLNIKNGQILNQAHLAHFEQGISDNSTDIEEIQNKIKGIEDNGGGNIPIVYPQQFGAVGDGETDDTKALVTALSHSNSVVDGGNKKYKYFEIIVNNVEDLEVRNVIFWKGANMVLEGCKNIRFVNCTWEGINPNGVNKIWTCGIRLRGRTNVSPTAKQLRNDAFKLALYNDHPGLRAHEYRSTIIENWIRGL